MEFPAVLRVFLNEGRLAACRWVLLIRVLLEVIYGFC